MTPVTGVPCISQDLSLAVWSLLLMALHKREVVVHRQRKGNGSGSFVLVKAVLGCHRLFWFQSGDVTIFFAGSFLF